MQTKANKKTPTLSNLAIILAGVALLMINKAIAISMVWAWFITHEYGVEAPPITVIMGVLFLILVSGRHAADSPHNKISAAWWWPPLLRIWLFTGMAWVVTLFM